MLVTGASGQVGRALVAAAPAAGVEVVGLDRAALDVTDADAVRQALALHRPDAVLNAAAYTAVDHAEAEPAQAFALNRDGAAHVARACAEAGAWLVHLSTDYVFDGEGTAPYREDDPVSPLGVYGRSKAAGEAAVRDALPGRHLVVRTSWVFSATGQNFVRTMLRLARERDALHVVADQQGCPTPADDLARDIFTMLQAAVARPDLTGTYHWAGTPPTSWHGLAEAVVDQARRHGPVAVRRVEPIATEAFPTPARRPAWSVLDTAKATSVFGLAPPDWRPALARVVRALAEGEAATGI